MILLGYCFIALSRFSVQGAFMILQHSFVVLFKLINPSKLYLRLGLRSKESIAYVIFHIFLHDDYIICQFWPLSEVVSSSNGCTMSLPIT